MSPIQSLELIGWAPENTFGTFVAPTYYVPGMATINTNTKNARPAQSRGSRSQVIDGIVGLETDVAITAELIPEVLAGLAAKWFGHGADAKTNAGAAYTHSLTPQNLLDSISVEVDTDVASQVLARQIVGCYVDQVTLRATNQAFATFEAACLGQREITPATPGLPSNPTPSISTLQPLDFSLLAATYHSGAVTTLIDLTLVMMNHVQRVFTNNGKLYISRLSPTLREVTLATTLDFLDSTFYSDWINGTKPANGIILTLTSPTNIPSTVVPYSISYTIPGVRPVGQFGLTAASDVLQEQLTWSVTQQGSNEISSVWTNGETATLA